MSQSTFNKETKVSNWVTIHSQTEKYVDIISTPRDGKVKHARVYQIALNG